MDKALRFEDGDFAVEFEVIPTVDESSFTDERKEQINQALNDIDKKIDFTNQKISELNSEIDRFTNHADGLDYMLAVGSGILTGLIDSFFVGEFNFKKSKANANEKVNEYIMKKAKNNGYEGDRLNGAIRFLENEFKVKQDNIWNGSHINVSAKSHHLDDLAHHPSLLGLLSAIMVEFLGIACFQSKDGKYHFKFVGIDSKKVIKMGVAIVISGIFLWLVKLAEDYVEDKFDTEIPKPIRLLVKLLATAPVAIQILKAAHNWAMHLVSDMGGSKNTAGGGMGIPGFFLSFFKEISMIPGINMTGLPKLVDDLYQNKKFDLRAEIAVLDELNRQAVPVIINEIFVRGFYFVRHLIEEIKSNNVVKVKNLGQINWNNVLPFGNRTIVRMMTIATGTMTAIDLGDAAIRAAAKSGGNALKFLKDFILSVNFVGIGRFAIAVTSDAKMGYKRSKLRNERMYVYIEQLNLLNAKVYYHTADMWISAEDTGKSIEEAYKQMQESVRSFEKAVSEIEDYLKKISEYVPGIEQHNPGLIDYIEDILKY